MDDGGGGGSAAKEKKRKKDRSLSPNPDYRGGGGGRGAKRKRSSSSKQSVAATRSARGSIWHPSRVKEFSQDVKGSSPPQTVGGKRSEKKEAEVPRGSAETMLATDESHSTSADGPSGAEGAPAGGLDKNGVSRFSKEKLELMPIPSLVSHKPSADATTWTAVLKARILGDARWKAAGLVLKRRPTPPIASTAFDCNAANLQATAAAVPPTTTNAGGPVTTTATELVAEAPVKLFLQEKPVLTFDGPAPDIGAGWMMRKYRRKRGAKKGREDRYWYSPLLKKKFRSRAEIERFKDALARVGVNDEAKAWKIFKK